MWMTMDPAKPAGPSDDHSDTVEDSAKLNKLIEEYWDWRLQDAPEFASLVDVHEYDESLESLSPKSWNARRVKCEEFLKNLNELNIQLEHLNDLDLITYKVFVEHLRSIIDGYEWRHYCAFNAVCFLENIPVDYASFIIPSMLYHTAKDFEIYIQRLLAIPKLLEEQQTLMKEAMDNKTPFHSSSVHNVPDQLDLLLAKDPADSIFFQPFSTKLPYVEEIPDEEKDQLCTEVECVLQDSVYPALASLARFLRQEYLPNSRTSLGVCSLDRGKEFYCLCLQWHLSLDMSPEDVHFLGLREVARIRQQMEAVVKDVNFDGDLHKFMQHLKTDRKFYHDSKEKLLDEYRDLIEKEINPKLQKFFHKIPDIPLEVQEMPFNGPGGQYNPPTSDGSRPGVFYVNLKEPEARPRFTMMALSLHEASPGHHFQISFLTTSDLPQFRKNPDYRKMYAAPCNYPIYTAYVEGWGLYSEFLGEEMGVFRNPYDLFGRYSEEIFRACRLVVDTGLHMFGWSKEQAITYLEENTCTARDEIEEEVDRYLTWPGQACAYKIGELKIKQLRRFAEQQLGEVFDVRDFHQVVLDVGPVPLKILENVVLHLIHEKSGNKLSYSEIEDCFSKWKASDK